MQKMLRAAACAFALSVVVPHVFAQSPVDYPKRPVRFIVAQTPGGSADFVGRIIAEALGKRLGQQFVVDNRRCSPRDSFRSYLPSSRASIIAFFSTQRSSVQQDL